MKNIYFFFLFLAFVFLSCNKDDDEASPSPAPAPVACFTIDANETGDSTHVFSFSNCSQNAFRSEWDFGDATYAPVPNPIHIYNQKGEFIVRLTVYNADGVSSNDSDTITIGRYMLDKIVYHHLWDFPMPKVIAIGSIAFNNYYSDTIPDSNTLPFTLDLPDNSIYNMPATSLLYGHREIDSAGVIHNGIFTVYNNDIINKIYSAVVPAVQHDTAKFTLYYKVVP